MEAWDDGPLQCVPGDGTRIRYVNTSDREVVVVHIIGWWISGLCTIGIRILPDAVGPAMLTFTDNEVYVFLMLRHGVLYVAGDVVWQGGENLCRRWSTRPASATYARVPGTTVRFQLDVDSGRLSLQVNDRFLEPGRPLGGGGGQRKETAACPGTIHTLQSFQRPIRPSCSCLPPGGAFDLFADEH